MVVLHRVPCLYKLFHYLEGKLFHDLNRMEAPKINLPPPFPYHWTLPGSFPILMPCLYKLNFPMYDGKEDPLPWINHYSSSSKAKRL